MKALLLLILLLSSLFSTNVDLDSYFENNGAIMILIDPSNGKIIRANKSALKFYGYSKKEFLNKYIQDINTFTKAQVKEEMKNAKLENRNYFIFRHKLKNKEIKRVEVYSYPINFHNKKILFSIIHDVSNLELAQQTIEHYSDFLEKQVDIKSKELMKKEHKQRELLGYAILILILIIIFLLKNIKKRKALEAKLSNLNRHLEEEVEKKIEDLRQKDDILYQQSKLASMGEMLGNIAHQWRQPLNTLSAYINNIKLSYKKGTLTQEKLNSLFEKSITIINKMDNTIDDFKNYYKPNKKTEEFYLSDLLDTSISFIKDDFSNNSIELINHSNINPKISSFKNELTQVLLNIFANSKDAILKRKVDGFIDIDLKETSETITITIQDNGGGVNEDIINKIFEPYFTTKFKSDGTGIGLYMSKMIVENSLNGIIYTTNKDQGLLTTIELKKEIADVTK